jgi:hypothetical protein
VKINSKGNENQTHHKVAFELVFLKTVRKVHNIAYHFFAEGAEK